MLIFYSIFAFVCYKLYRKMLSDYQIILDNLSIIDLYDNTYDEYNSKEHNSKEFNSNNDVLFAFNQIPT